MKELTAVRRSQSTVVVTGTRRDGSTEVQEITLKHDPGAPDAVIIGHGFARVNQCGGFMLDGEDGAVVLYPLSSFEKVVFGLRKVSLATVGVH